MLLYRGMHQPPGWALFWIHVMKNDGCGNAASNQIIQCSTMLKQWSEAMETPVLSCYITPIYKFMAVGHLVTFLRMLPACLGAWWLCLDWQPETLAPGRTAANWWMELYVSAINETCRKPFLFAVRLLLPSCWTSTAISSRTTRKLVDRVWQGLFSAPKFKRCGQAYTYMFKIFSSPEQGEFICSASCKWSPDELFAPAISQAIPECLAWHVPYLCEEAC